MVTVARPFFRRVRTHRVLLASWWSAAWTSFPNTNPQYAKVMKRLRDANGIPIGVVNENRILDSCMYEVEYQDGTKASLANLFAQVDQECNRHVLLDELVDYRVNGHEVKLQDAFITTGTGTRRRCETTIGWDLLAQWKDGSTNLIS